VKDYNYQPFEEYPIEEGTRVRIGTLRESTFGGDADTFILPLHRNTTSQQERRLKAKYEIEGETYKIEYVDDDITKDLTPQDRTPITMDDYDDVNFDPEDWEEDELEDQGDGALAEYLEVGDTVRVGKLYREQYDDIDDANWFALPLKSATSSSQEERILENYEIRIEDDTVSSVKFVKDLTVVERTILSTDNYSDINFNPEDWSKSKLQSIRDYLAVGKGVRLGKLKTFIFDQRFTNFFSIPLKSEISAEQEAKLQEKYEIRSERYEIVEYISDNLSERFVVRLDGHGRTNFDVDDWTEPEPKPEPKSKADTYIKVDDTVRIGILRGYTEGNVKYALPLIAHTSIKQDRMIEDKYLPSVNTTTVRGIHGDRIITDNFNLVFNIEDWDKAFAINYKMRPKTMLDLMPISTKIQVLKVKSNLKVINNMPTWIGIPPDMDWDKSIYDDLGIRELDESAMHNSSDWHHLIDSNGSMSVIANYGIRIFPEHWPKLNAAYPGICPKAILPQVESRKTLSDLFPVGTRVRVLSAKHDMDVRAGSFGWIGIPPDMDWDKLDYNDLGILEIKHEPVLDQSDWHVYVGSNGNLRVSAGNFTIDIFPDMWPKLQETYSGKCPKPIMPIKKQEPDMTSKLKLDEFLKSDLEIDTVILNNHKFDNSNANWFAVPKGSKIDTNKYHYASGKEATITRVHDILLTELLEVKSHTVIRTTNSTYQLNIDLSDWPEIMEALTAKKEPKLDFSISSVFSLGTEFKVLCPNTSSMDFRWIVVPDDFKINSIHYSVTGHRKLTAYSHDPSEDQSKSNWTIMIDDNGAINVRVGDWNVFLYPEHWGEFKKFGVPIPKAILPHQIPLVSIDKSGSVSPVFEIGSRDIAKLTIPVTGVDPVLTSPWGATLTAADLVVADLREEKTMAFAGMNLEKIFGSAIGKDTTDMFKLSMMGIAIKGDNGSYRCYDPEQGSCIDVMEMVIDANNMIFRMPAQAVVAGDLIISNGKPYYVISKVGQNISVFNPIEEKIETIVPSRSMFGWNFFIKVVSMFNMMGATPNTGSLQAMMPMIMMSMFSGGDMFGSKPKPGSPGYGSSDKKNPMEAMMPMMMISQMMGGGMGNMFGGTAPVDGAVDPMAAMMPMMMMSMFSGGDMGEGMESMMPMMMMSQMMKGFGAPEPVKEKRSHKKKVDVESTNTTTEDSE